VRVWAAEEGAGSATSSHTVKVLDDCLACQYSDIELSPEVSKEEGQRAHCAMLRCAMLLLLSSSKAACAMAILNPNSNSTMLLVQAFLAVTGSNAGPKPVEWDFVPCHDPSLTPTSLSTAALNATTATPESPVAGSARRMLQRSGDKNKRRAEVSEEVVFTDWVVPCQEGRLRCSNLYLASQGYQVRLAGQLSQLTQAAGWFLACILQFTSL
jgi:hypothetical protein